MMKKYFSLIVFALALTFCFGCSSSRNESVITKGVTGVFRSTVIPIPEGYGVFTPCRFDGDHFTADLFFTDSDGSYYNDYNRKSMTFGIDGSILSVTDADETDASGSGWIFGNSHFDFDGESTLAYISGNDQIFELNLEGIFKYDSNELADRKKSLDSALSIIEIEAGSNNEYYILTTKGLCAVSENGKLNWMQNKLDAPNDIIMTKYGLIYFGGEKENKAAWLVNDKNGSLKEKIEMPPQITDGSGIGAAEAEVSFYSCDSPDSEFDFFAATKYALWGVSLSEARDGKLTGEVSECLNWVNADISSSAVSNLCVANESALTLTRRKTNENQLILMTKVPDDDVAQKESIILASLSEDNMMNSVINSAIEEFNISNPDYRILMTDFTVYDKDTRSTIFNAELAAGNVPDIVIISNESESDTLVNKYVSSGIFCDLSPLMEGNNSFNYNDLLGYVRKPYLIDGKQYIFPLKPTTRTQFGLGSYFSGPLTAEETFDAIKALSDETYWTNSSIAFSNYTLQSTFEDFVDRSGGTCSFDSKAFVSILQELLDMDEKVLLGLATQKEYFPLISNGSLRLMAYAPSSLRDYVSLSYYFNGEAVAVGYPNAAKKLYIQNSIGTYLAITDGSKNKEIAFDFINYIYDSLVASDYREGNFAFFKEDVYRQLDKYDDKVFAYEDGSVRSYDEASVPDSKKQVFKITTQDAERYIDFLNSIDAILPSDSPIYAIVSEEFYNGGAENASKMAEIIQSRVEMYMAEKYQ